MKKIFALATLVLFAVACSKDDSSEKGNSGPILLKRMTETYDNGSSVTSEYKYDEDRLTSIIYSDGTIVSYFYETADKNISRTETRKNGVLIEEENFDYQSIAYLGKYEKKSQDNYTMVRGFSYYNYMTPASDDNDREYIGCGTSVTKDDSGEIYYQSKLFMNGNNIQMSSDEYRSDFTLTRSYQYDAKNSPFRNISSYKFIIMARQDSGMNNLLSMNSNGPGTDEKISVTYTYNSDNYPATSQETGKDGKKVKREYFY